MRKYWITTHWPPEIGTSLDYGVFLYHGSQSVGAEIEPGDRVWIYQSKEGRQIVRERPDGSKYRTRRYVGKEGVIALAEVIGALHEIGVEPEKYHDGTQRWWRWKGDTRLINQSGFVPRRELNLVLGYKVRNRFRGFGDRKSGLKRISKETYEKILEVFNQNQPPETKASKRNPRKYISRGPGQGGEGPVHKKLKETVAADPAGVLGEEGLEFIQMEFPFPTGDRADILLKDAENRYVTVEIEVGVDMDDISGVLQAAKYRHMYAIECRRRYEEIRTFLVAYQISKDVEGLCRRYEIETFTIERA